MPVYNLITNATTSQTISAVNVNGGPNQGVKATGPDDNPNSPTQSQAFMMRVDGIGACGATVQPVVSMDGKDWTNFGSAQSVSGSSVDLTPAEATFTTSAPFPYFGGYCTVISGTNAKVNLKLSA